MCDAGLRLNARGADEVWIVRVHVRPEKMTLFQALVQAEEGLGVVRCRDPEKRLQEIWTTAAMRKELLALLAGLPKALAVQVVEVVPWRPGL